LWKAASITYARWQALRYSGKESEIIHAKEKSFKQIPPIFKGYGG